MKTSLAHLIHGFPSPSVEVFQNTPEVTVSTLLKLLAVNCSPLKQTMSNYHRETELGNLLASPQGLEGGT